MPTAATILAEFVQAIGGKEAWNKLSSRRIKAEMEMMETTAEWISEAKAPNKQRSQTTLPGAGLLENGFDGTNAWSKSKAGLKISEGGELERTKRHAEFRRELYLKDVYPGLVFKGTGGSVVKGFRFWKARIPKLENCDSISTGEQGSWCVS